MTSVQGSQGFSLLLRNGMNRGEKLKYPADYLNGPMRRRNTKGYDPDTMTGRVPGCGIIRDG
ncbi:MAG: hypothetical protein JW999_07820, partial [Methanotrichaceae archaeon]|nr:hypothetical protein [Methanotrichaceae archaeon]